MLSTVISSVYKVCKILSKHFSNSVKTEKLLYPKFAGASPGFFEGREGFCKLGHKFSTVHANITPRFFQKELSLPNAYNFN